MSIKIENVEVMGWEAAIRGARNPMNSWAKSDSKWWPINAPGTNPAALNDKYLREKYCIGDNDLNLMKKLCKAGTDHRKFMRMITVYMDITAPFYLWKEFSTYKVGTVANSCSTMHKIHEKEFTLDDLSYEHLMTDGVHCYPLGGGWRGLSPIDTLKATIELLNNARQLYLKTKDKKYWWQIIQLLPSSYNQKRTVMLNYEVLANMYHSRKAHKLDEWREFCKFIETLPYSELITGDDGMYSSPLLDPKYQDKNNESEK